MFFQRLDRRGRRRRARAAAAALGFAGALAARAVPAAPLDEPFVGGMSFSGPTSGNVAAVYWNPAAVGLVHGIEVMAAGSGRLASTRATLAGAQASASDLSQPIQWPLGPGGFLGAAWNLGADRFALAFATYTPYAQKVTFPISGTRDEPTRYHVLAADLRNVALVPALSIRFGEFRAGFAPGFLFSTGRLAFDEPLPGNPMGDARLDIDSGQGLGDAKFSFTLAGGIYFRRRTVEFGLAYQSRPIGGDVPGVEVGGERSSVTFPSGAGITCGMPDPANPAEGIQKTRCVFGDIAYHLPDVWTGGATWHPSPGLELTAMVRWIRFHVHDRIDVRMTGPTLEAAGVPQHIVLYRGFDDAWDMRFRIAYWWREWVRVGATLRLETSAVAAPAVNAAAVDGLKLEPVALAEVRIFRHLWLGAGYGIVLMPEVTASPSRFDPGAAAACTAAAGDLNNPGCQARLDGRARPSAEGTYRRAVQDFGLTMTARF